VLAFAAALQLSPPRADAALVNCTIDASLDTEEKVFLTLINNHRAQNGLAPLAASYKLSKAAQWKSNDLGVNAYFAHDDLNRTWVQRIRDCGYGYNTYLGENIAAGISGAQAAFDLWRNSAGHNANMLGANYTAIGIGRAYVAGSPYGWYWTTEFGGVDDGWATATEPAPTIADDVTPPALRLIARGRADGALHLRALADDDTGVERVEFCVGGALAGVDADAPYALIWRGERRDRTVYAMAYDAAGNATRSDAGIGRRR
jgi:uncharacterized protein YkwD